MEREVPQEQLYHIAQQEQREREQRNFALWTGGLLEVGGSLYYQMYEITVKGKNYSYARPAIEIVDNNEFGVRKLAEILGGTVQNRSSTKNSWQWRLQGNSVIPLALAIRPFAPSRQDFMVIAEQWDSMTPAERYETVKDAQRDPQKNKPVILAPDAYTALVQQPAFVAGVVDSRGRVYKPVRKDNYSDYHYIDITTHNLALLEALKHTFGGSVQVQRGSLGSENDGYRYTLSHRATRTLYEFVRPHLLLRAEQAAQVFSETQP